MSAWRAATAAVLLVLLPAGAFAAEVNGTLGIDPTHRSGTDSQGRVLLFTPNPLQPGSSISHWDNTVFPDLLMEPSASNALPFGQVDLTTPAFRDTGWSTAGTSNVVLRVLDPPGQGFNDPTFGSQRMAAMQFVANTWGNILRSPVTINVDVDFQSLQCGNGSGVLAQAGPVFVYEDFPNAPVPNTWYSGALAESLSGQNLSLEDDPNPNAGDLGLTFNTQVDQACLGAGSRFYYGLDGNVPANQISFVNVALHEMGHGLGFVSFVNGSTGGLFTPAGFPPQADIFTRFLFDNDQNLRWHQMSNAQRRTSAVNTNRVSWFGNQVTAQAANFLQPGPTLRINSPASVAGFYRVGIAQFGPPLSTPGVSGNIVEATPAEGCGALGNAAQIAGNVALIDRGTCFFTDKVKNAQDAGAVAAIIVNNDAGTPPNMSGTDPAIVIPSVSISRADGQRIREALDATDPAGQLQFAAAALSVGEGAGNATVTVTRTGGTTGEVSVSYATSDGTATAGEDYVAQNGTLTFGAGVGGSQSFQVPILDDELEEGAETINLALENPTGGAALGNPSSAVLTVGDNEACTPDERTLCLNGGRFRVQVDWRNFVDETGFGQDVGFGSDDSGLMYFFDPDNWEMLIKVLDGCGFNGHFWVFAAATTNVEYRMTVTDTLTGEVRDDYFNPLGTAADAITDVQAFATCP